MIIQRSVRVASSLFVVILAAYLGLQTAAQAPNLRPEQGYVPDAATAIKVADAILVAMFGEEYVKNERPFSATLKEGIWIVRGHTFDVPHPGGSVEIQVNKKSACIVSLTRGK